MENTINFYRTHIENEDVANYLVASIEKGNEVNSAEEMLDLFNTILENNGYDSVYLDIVNQKYGSYRNAGFLSYDSEEEMLDFEDVSIHDIVVDIYSEEFVGITYIGMDYKAAELAFEMQEENRYEDEEDEESDYDEKTERELAYPVFESDYEV